MKKWINSVCIDAPTVKQDFSFVALPDSLFVKGTQWRSPLQSKKSKGHSGGFQNHKSLLLNVSAAMVVILHVLHSDSAPDANHKCFDLALIFSPNDAEVAVLAPVLSPGVGSNLRIKSIIQQLHKQFQPMIISVFFTSREEFFQVRNMKSSGSVFWGKKATYPVFSWCPIIVSVFSPPVHKAKQTKRL